jgi:hypothetical protein
MNTFGTWEQGPVDLDGTPGVALFCDASFGFGCGTGMSKECGDVIART